MNANKTSIESDWIDPDDAPDLTAPIWQEHIAKTAKRGAGRPPSLSTKVHQTLRLDPDVLTFYKSTGTGWQTRMNDALRKAAGLS
jgi:uncharacterized protein (DUF4415 family)